MGKTVQNKKPAKAAAKKATPAKKASAVKKGKAPSQRDVLQAELVKIARELNEEALAILIKQGLVLRHNMQVDQIRDSLAKTKPAAGKGAKKPARSGADKMSIEIVEGENNSNFIFVINNYRNFFSLDEMRKIVALCHAASDVRDGSARLYAWFKRERMDVINNTDIVNSSDPALATMYNAVIAKYTVRK